MSRVLLVLALSCALLCNSRLVSADDGEWSDDVAVELMEESASAQMMVQFESEEHRSICRDAANSLNLATLAQQNQGTLPPMGKLTVTAGEGSTPAKMKAAVGELHCQKQEDYFGSDELRIDVYADGKKVDTIGGSSGMAMKTGDKKNLGKTYEFTKDLRFDMWDLDVGVAVVDEHDNLGSATVNIPGTHRLSFMQHAQYYLSVVVTSTASGGQQPALVTFSSTKGNVAVGYDDICSLSGDFLVGPDPKTSVISVNPDKSYAKRTETEMQQVFTTAFDGWYAKMTSTGDADFKVMIARLKGLMDKEANAIARHKGKNIAIAFAYAEHDSPFGGKTLSHVTNSHNNNMAKAMLGQEPDIDYHYSTSTMALASNNLKNSPYLRNAIWNLDHFVDSFSKDVWVAVHKLAIQTAVSAAKAATPQDKAKLLTKALIQNAAGDHYACDRFAAGHQRDPRREMLMNPHPGCDMERTGLAAKMMHDEDNAVGLSLKNGRGAKWRAYGDKWLNSRNNEANYKNAVEFVKASITEVMTAFFKGVAPTDLTGSTSAFSLLPDLDTSAQSHPPLFRRNNNRWEYRTSLFDRPATYTTDWTCDLFAPFSSTSSTNSRFEDNTATIDIIKRRMQQLQETYFAQMDKNKDGRVLIDEFVAWLQFVVPEVKQSDVTGRVVIQKFFAKFPVVDKGALTVQDFDYLLAIRTDQSIGLLTMEQFVRVELLAILEEVQGNPSPRFAELVPGVSRQAGPTVLAPSSSNARATSGSTSNSGNTAPNANANSGSGRTVDSGSGSTSSNTNNNAPEDNEVLGGIVWSRIRKAVDAANPDSASIKQWDKKVTMEKMKLHAATLAKKKLLPNNPTFHQYRWLIDEELRRAEKKYIMLQQTEVSLDPAEKKSWAAICLWASMDPLMKDNEKKNLEKMTEKFSKETREKFRKYLGDAKFAGGRAGARAAAPATTESGQPSPNAAPNTPPNVRGARGKSYTGPPKNVVDEINRLANFIDDKNNKDVAEAVKNIVSASASIVNNVARGFLQPN